VPPFLEMLDSAPKTTPLMAGFINLIDFRSLAVRKYLAFYRSKYGGKKPRGKPLSPRPAT